MANDAEIFDVVAELRKYPDDVIRMRAAEEIDKLRGVIVRNCGDRGASNEDRVVILGLKLKALRNPD